MRLTPWRLSFQSAGRIIGWLKRIIRRQQELLNYAKFQSAGRIIGWLKTLDLTRILNVQKMFQSAGRIIGWMKASRTSRSAVQKQFQSAGRIIGWMKPFTSSVTRWTMPTVSIRRADYWLDEVASGHRAPPSGLAFQSAGRIIGWMKTLAQSLRVSGSVSFNPPGGLLVG